MEASVVHPVHPQEEITDRRRRVIVEPGPIASSGIDADQQHQQPNGLRLWEQWRMDNNPSQHSLTVTCSFIRTDAQEHTTADTAMLT